MATSSGVSNFKKKNRSPIVFPENLECRMFIFQAVTGLWQMHAMVLQNSIIMGKKIHVA